MPDYSNPYPWLTPNGLWKPIRAAMDANTVSMTVFISDGYYVVRDVREVHGTASSSGTLQVEKATSGVAPGSGTVQLTGTINLAATANVPLRGTVIAAPDVLAPGDMLNIVIGGTMTNLAGACVIIMIERLRKGEF